MATAGVNVNMLETSKMTRIEQWLKTSQKLDKRMESVGIKDTNCDNRDNCDQEVSLNFKGCFPMKRRSNRQLTSKKHFYQKLHKLDPRPLFDSNGEDLHKERIMQQNEGKRVMKHKGKSGKSGRANHGEDASQYSQSTVNSTTTKRSGTKSAFGNWHMSQLQQDELPGNASAPGSINTERGLKVGGDNWNWDFDEQSVRDEEHQQQEVDERSLRENEEELQRIKDEEELIADYKIRLQNKDNTVVFNLFEMLIEKMQQVQDDIRSMKTRQNTVSRKLKSLESNLNGKVNKEDVEHIHETKSQTILLTQAIVKQEQSFLDVQSKVGKLEKLVTRGTFVINGIPEDKDEDPIGLVIDFLSNKMSIEPEIPIMSAHRIGTGKKRLLWFKITDPDDTSLIYQHMKNLKDRKNKFDEAYRINEQFTEGEREKRRRQNDILMDNRRTPASHQLTILKKKGELEINGELYQKAVEPPLIRDVIQIAKSKMEQLEELEVHHIGFKELNESIFYSYIANVESHAEVKLTYQKVKREHIGATHVMCAYRIFHANAPVYQDYSDDGEIGGASRILNVLKSVGAFNTVVFIVRYHEGPNLGPLRFDIITDLTQEAVAESPSPIDYGQTCGKNDHPLLDSLKKSTRKQGQGSKSTKQYVRTNIRGRGGGAIPGYMSTRSQSQQRK